MTKNSFKKSLQNEIKFLKDKGIDNTILSVSDFPGPDGVNNTILFKYSLTPSLMEWLQDRFMWGVTEVDNTSVKINTPNQSNKKVYLVTPPTAPRAPKVSPYEELLSNLHELEEYFIYNSDADYVGDGKYEPNKAAQLLNTVIDSRNLINKLIKQAILKR